MYECEAKPRYRILHAPLVEITFELVDADLPLRAVPAGPCVCMCVCVLISPQNYENVWEQNRAVSAGGGGR